MQLNFATISIKSLKVYWKDWESVSQTFI